MFQKPPDYILRHGHVYPSQSGCRLTTNGPVQAALMTGDCKQTMGLCTGIVWPLHARTRSHSSPFFCALYNREQRSTRNAHTTWLCMASVKGLCTHLANRLYSSMQCGGESACAMVPDRVDETGWNNRADMTAFYSARCER